MALIKQVGAELFNIEGYSFLSFNKRGIKTTAYYVNDTNCQQGIGLSLFTANNDVTVNVSSYNLFYENDLSFDEAFISGFGGLVEEERQACIHLLEVACAAIPKRYKIQYSNNVETCILGEVKSCLK